jgi:hypothetical protein
MVLMLFGTHVNLFVDSLNGFLSLSNLTVLTDVQSEVVAEETGITVLQSVG